MSVMSGRRRGLVTVLACVLALCLSLVGCGGSGEETTDASKTFVGTWEAISMATSDETMSEDDLAALKELGLTIQLSLSDDGSFSLDVMGEAVEGTWEAKDSSTISLTAEGSTIEGTLADDQLTLEEEGTTLVFSKTSDTPTALTQGDEVASVEATTGDEVSSEVDNLSTDGTGMTALGHVVTDDDSYAIVLVSSGADETGDPGYVVEVTNKTTDAISVGIETGSFTIYGTSLDPTFELVVQPGESAEGFMYFSASELGGGVERLVDLSGTFVVRDSATMEDLVYYEVYL